MSLVQRLRAETAADHERVDAVYGRFGFGDRDDYARFLAAHARALPAAEAAIGHPAALPPWRERTALLAADLADAAVPMPPTLAFGLDSDAARWGALYVIEGSRLGGMLLARQVPADLPSRYLADKHLPGEWRAFMLALDAAPFDANAVLDAARETFRLYERAAG